MRLFFLLISLTILAFLPGRHIKAQNRYTPPEPYGIVDGNLHYTKYMIMNTAFLGPNGLPVPGLHKGVNPKKFNIEMKYEYYFQDREQTHDALLEMTIPVSHGKAAIEFRYVPFEFYEVSKSLSRERRSESGEELSGHSLGDVYFGTTLQLVEGHRWLPDILFGMSCKTASGTNLEDARHTDAPGYYFDLSFGKSYNIGIEKKSSLRWFMLGGFYAWQTYLDDFPQNDAIFYGLGLNLDLGFLYWSNSLRGLSGYMFNGDQPVVFFSELGIREGRSALTLGYEWGLVDYPFKCFRLGFKIDGMIE